MAISSIVPIVIPIIAAIVINYLVAAGKVRSKRVEAAEKAAAG